MSEWISVKDRLPPGIDGRKRTNEDKVFIFDTEDGGEIYSGYYSNKYGWEVNDVSLYNVTHWQPRMEFPK